MEKHIKQIEQFKKAMANYPTGVTVVTATDENNKPVGLTVNSFASVSLEPLLILWSIDKGASTYERFMKVNQFSVNILAEDQADIASLFASGEKDRFGHCDWQLSKDNLPIIDQAMANLECRVFQKIEAGDHLVFIGEIFQMSVAEKAPLLYHQRKIGALPKIFHKK